MKTFRERSRINAMRETQRQALGLFQEHGYGRVTVEDISASVGMSASTIYRHFGTKESIVLWFEHDDEVDKALGSRLIRQPPLEAIRDSLIDTVAVRWDDDPFELERVSYIYRTEQLHAAAVEGDYRDRAELTAALQKTLPKDQKDAASILAGAALLALDVAVDRWQQANGREKLRQHIIDAFDTLCRLDQIG